ncbi:MAG: recombinase family protein [Oscillospiraceae bacterium]
MNTGIYLRKSRAEELTDSTEETLKRHKDTLLEFAQQYHLTIIETYEEVISGENLYTRTEMLRLLSDVEIGKLEAVLCMDIDRLGRGSMSQQGVILETFKSANVKIVTPRKTYDLNNELDEEYTEFQTFFARRELKTIKRRMRQGINKSLQDGGYIANAPYGYLSCRIGKLPSLKIVDDEAEFVKMMFDMYANQGCGCHAIAETLNSLGAIPKRGAKFSRTTVKSIIQNEVYIGKVVWNKRRHRKPDDKNEKNWSTLNPESEWIISQGLHPAIIHTEVFQRAKEILSGRYHPPYFSGKLTNPLAGILTCAKCGGKMVRREFTHGDIIYMMCPTSGCVKMTSFFDVEEMFLATIREQLAGLKVKVSTPVQSSNNLIEKAILSTKKEINIVQTQKEKLHDFLEQGVYSLEVFLERTSALDKKTEKLSVAIKQLQVKIENKKLTNLNVVCQKVENVLDAYDVATINEKNRLLKMIVSSALYYKEKQWPSGKFILRVTLNGT